MEEAVGRVIHRQLLISALTLLAVLTAGRVQAQSADEAPIAQAYLYVEPFQARVEVLFDVSTVMGWLKKEVHPSGQVSPAEQKMLREEFSTMAAPWCKLRTDDEDKPGTMTGVAFVKGKPGQTLPVADNETIAAKELMVGVMYDFSIPGSPERVEVRWGGLQAPVTTLPLTVFFGNSTEQLDFTTLRPYARWNNNNRLPRPKALAQVPEIKLPDVYPVPVAMIVWALFGFSLFIWMKVKDHRWPGGFAPFFACWVLGIALTYSMTVNIPDPSAPKAPPVDTPEKAEAILSPLLKNVYRAFDYRKESDIYDRLERSVHGELLRRLYLQTVQALTLDGSEGARVRVTDLSVTIDQVKLRGSGFEAEGEWTALGTVGHWGHQHQRVNRYKAKLHVEPIVDSWKISGLEVLEERRL